MSLRFGGRWTILSERSDGKIMGTWSNFEHFRLLLVSATDVDDPKRRFGKDMQAARIARHVRVIASM